MGAGFYRPAIIKRNGDDLHGTKRAGYHAGFAADALALVNLHTLSDAGYCFIWATAGTWGIFTVAASHGIASSLMLNHRNPWLELLAGQNMLFFIVGHHTCHFAGMAANTLLSISENKTIHLYPLPVIKNRRRLLVSIQVAGRRPGSLSR